MLGKVRLRRFPAGSTRPPLPTQDPSFPKCDWQWWAHSASESRVSDTGDIELTGMDAVKPWGLHISPDNE